MEGQKTIIITTDDSKRLCSALLLVPTDTIAAFLALYQDTEFQKLLRDRVIDFAQQTKGEFQRRLDRKTNEIASLPRAELTIRVFTELNKGLCLSPRHYASKRDFEDNCKEIVRSTIALAQKIFDDFEGDSLSKFCRYYVDKTINEAKQKFTEMSVEQQEDALNALRSYINSLPADKQIKIKKELGVDTLSDAYLQRIVQSGKLWVAFKTIVMTAGFSVYAGLTSFLAGTAGIVGLTLPFGVYSSAVSLTAVLANPIFLVGAFAGYSYYFVNKNNKDLKQRLIPIIIAQILLQGMEEIDERDSDKEACAAVKVWAEAKESIDVARKEYFEVCEKLSEVQANEREICKQVEESREHMKNIEKKRKEISKSLHEKILSSSEDVANGLWGRDLEHYGRVIVERRQHFEKAKNEWESKSRTDRIFCFPSQLKDKIKLEKSLEDIANECVYVAKRRWDEGIRDLPQTVSIKFAEWNDFNAEFNAKNGKHNELLERKAALENAVAQYEESKKKTALLRKQAENRFWGLDSL